MLRLYLLSRLLDRLISLVFLTMMGIRVDRYFSFFVFTSSFRISSSFLSSSMIIIFFTPTFFTFSSCSDSLDSLSLVFFFSFTVNVVDLDYPRFVIRGRLLLFLYPRLRLRGRLQYSLRPSLRQSRPFWVTQILLPLITDYNLFFMSKKLSDDDQESPRFGGLQIKAPSKAGLYGQSQAGFMKEAEKHASQKQTRNISIQQLSQHKTKKSAWISLKGVVYDVTDYMKYHPGGDELLEGCGKESQKLFDEHHSWVNAKFMLKKYVIGTLNG